MKEDRGINPHKDKNGEIMPGAFDVQVYLLDEYTGRKRKARRVSYGGIRKARALKKEMEGNPSKYLKREKRFRNFDAYAQEWLKRMERKSREEGKPTPRRVDDLRRYVAVLVGYLGDMPLDRIDPATIENMLDRAREDKSRRLGRPVSSKTMNKLYGAMNQIMKKAYFDGLVPFNPCDRVDTPPATGEADRRSLEHEEVRDMLAAIELQEREAYERFEAKEQRLIDSGHANKERSSMKNVVDVSHLVGVQLALMCGLRRGEVLGLRWGDVDLEGSLIVVRHSLTIERELKGTKTCNVRTLPLEKGLRESLQRLRDFQGDCLRKLELLGEDEDVGRDRYVVCNNLFEATDPANFSRWFDAWKVRTDGVPDDIRLHELRTTFGTFNAEELPRADVARAMGHASPTTTEKYYQKALRENDRKPAEIMGRYRSRKVPQMQVFDRKTG